jgi:hypothetical protein
VAVAHVRVRQDARVTATMSQLLGDAITIVSGLPRSGTSMMMRMLAAGGVPPLTDDVRKADEDNPLGYFEFEPVKQTKRDPSWLGHAGGKAVKMVYRLLYDLPADHRYRVIFMRRTLEEVIASQDAMLSRRGRRADTLSRDRLRGLFDEQLREFEQWVARQPNFRILYVSYNDVLADARAAAQAVNAFLGGVLDVVAMTEVVEPALYRQRAQQHGHLPSPPADY